MFSPHRHQENKNELQKTCIAFIDEHIVTKLLLAKFRELILLK